MAVSPRQRKIADTISQSVERLGILGVFAATVIGRRMHVSALAAYRRGRNPAAVTQAGLKGMIPLLVDAMVSSYLNGTWQLFLLAKLRRQNLAISFSTSVYRQQLRVLVRRTGLSDAKLKLLTKAYGAIAAEVIGGVSEDVNRKIGRAIAETKRRGEHVREGVERLKGALENAGVSPLRSNQLEAVFRTQTMLANNAGAYLAAQDPDLDEILWGYTYASVGDDRVRPTHNAMDGVTLPKDDKFWNKNYPPNGWNCRCQVIPVFESATPVRPPSVTKDDQGNTVKVEADEGFDFHPGKAYQAVGGIPGRVPVGLLPTPKVVSPSAVVTKKAKAKRRTKRVLTTKRPILPKLSGPKEAVIKPIKRTRGPKVAISKPQVVIKKLPRLVDEKIPKPIRISKTKPPTIKPFKISKQTTVETLEKQQRKLRKIRSDIVIKKARLRSLKESVKSDKAKLRKATPGKSNTLKFQERHGLKRITTTNKVTEVQLKKTLEMADKEIDRILKNNPRLVAHIDETGGLLNSLHIEGHNPRRNGQYTPRFRKITISVTDTRLSRDSLTIGKWTANDGVAGTFRHELGHRVVETELYQGGKSGNAFRELWDNSNKGKAFEKSVSRYAATDIDELYAESFAVYTSPNYQRGVLPRPLEGFFDKWVRG